MSKLIGHINGVPVYEDPSVPSGTLYFLNENVVYGKEIAPLLLHRSRWQRIKDWIKFKRK